MAQDLLALMWVPFLMCMVLTGIHAYLGLHVIAREVVFVDIALAQIAALGTTAAFLWDHHLDSWASYIFGLSFTILGATSEYLAGSRSRKTRGCSMTWSSTEMIFASSGSMRDSSWLSSATSSSDRRGGRGTRCHGDLPCGSGGCDKRSRAVHD